jgi:glutamate formiminotransferase/formiminotetrahydrofolate cyclodeaminase
MDVCPFIPVSNITMHECIDLSKQFAQRLSKELNVPIYLYAESQPDKKRSELPDIRKGEYEALQEKLKSDDMKPDYGPFEFVPSWGATCVGAREFLVAFNINVLGTKEQAHRIALNVREQGRSDKEVCTQSHFANVLIK